MLCDEHKDQNVVAYCEDCDTLVCYDCITDTHKKHEFEKLANVAKIKRETILDEFVSKKDSILSELRESYEELELSKKEDQQLEESTIKEIYDRAEEIKSNVDHIRDKQVSKVRDLFRSQRTVLEGKLISICAAIETVTNISDDPDSLQNKSDVEIIQLHTCVTNKLEESKNRSQFRQIEGKFVSGGDFEKSLEEKFGSFEKETEFASDDINWPNQVKTKSKSLKRVDIGLKCQVKSLFMTGDDSGLILGTDRNLYFANSISKKEYKEMAKGVLSFAVSKEEEVYIVTSSSIIQKINTDGTVTRWCDMTPFKPQQIFIKRSDEISVLLCPNTYFGHTGTIEYLLCKFDSNGIRIDQGKQTFTKDVMKIAENEFREICLNYRDNYKYTNNLFTVDVNNSESDFKGVLGAKPSETLNISDFCYTSNGRIVALDSTNHVIYLLDRKCSFIKFLTSVGEIKSPQYVSLDCFERLWISDSSGTYILSNWDQ